MASVSKAATVEAAAPSATSLHLSIIHGMAAKISFSSTVTMSSTNAFQISKLYAPTVLTARPSIMIGTLSSVTSRPASMLRFIAGAKAISTPMTLMSGLINLTI